MSFCELLLLLQSQYCLYKKAQKTHYYDNQVFICIYNNALQQRNLQCWKYFLRVGIVHSQV